MTCRILPVKLGLSLGLLFWLAGQQTAIAQDAPLTLTVQAERSSLLSRDRADIRKIPGNAGIATDENWRGQRAATIKDATDYIPGVYTQPRNGAESSRLSIRGSGLANNFQGRGLLVLQDGVPINMADGEFEFPVIDPWLIDHVRSLPGANALAEGGSNLGGALDFITQTGETAPGIGTRLEGGSFGTKHALTSYGRSWRNGDAYAAVSGFDQGGFRDHNEQNNLRLNANAGWRPDADTSHRLYVSHTISNAEIPGAISRAELRDNPRAANPNNAARDFRRDLDITRIAHRGSFESDGGRLDTTLYYMYRTLDNPVTTYIREDNNDGGLRLKYTYDDGPQTWIAGFNAAYGDQDETRYANVAGQEGATILNRDLNALALEWFGEYSRDLGAGFRGVASAQAAYHTRTIDEVTPAEESFEEEYAGFSPRLGLLYDLSPAAQLFANVSRSFEPPTFGELSGGNSPGFNDLDAQTATTGEVGARGQYQSLEWSAAYYYGALRDEFVNYRFADGSTDTINVDKSIHQGIELGLGGDAARSLFVAGDAIALRGNYIYSDFCLDDDPLYGDNQLPGAPEHYLRAEALYRLPFGLSFGPSVEWSPSAYPVDLTNSVESDSYAVYGARVQWDDPQARGTLYLEVRNLLNRDYAATTNVVPDAGGNDGRYFYPGEGRAVYAGLSWRF